MPVVISGTNGVSGVDGTASNPSYEGTDSNTGIFFPAADTIAFAEGGTEVARFDSSGNLGIGTSSPASKLQVSVTSGTLYQYITNTGTGDAGVRMQSSTTADYGIFADSANALRFYDFKAVADRMRIDSSGNVGIGTSSPVAKLSVEHAIALAGGGAAKPSGLDYGMYLLNGVGTVVHSAAVLAFAAGGTERARITSGGEVLVGGNTDNGAYNLQCNGTGVWGAGAYVNGSDARIKEDVAPIAFGLDVVTKLNPVTYRYKESWTKDQSTQTGFIAQELLTALDGQVYVDGVVQQGGSEGYYSVAYQNIIPILTKAIQEQQQMIETLQAKVAALEAK